MACRIAAAEDWGIGCGMQLSVSPTSNPGNCVTHDVSSLEIPKIQISCISILLEKPYLLCDLRIW
jgi:hypothetical protein